MEVYFRGDGKGIVILLRIDWMASGALAKSMVATVVTLVGLGLSVLAAPEVVRLMAMLNS